MVIPGMLYLLLEERHSLIIFIVPCDRVILNSVALVEHGTYIFLSPFAVQSTPLHIIYSGWS